MPGLNSPSGSPSTSSGLPPRPPRHIARPKQPAKFSRPRWSSPPRVLLVDDDVVYRMLSGRLLKVFGCTIDTADDGVVAVDVLKMNLGKYDLVFMDIMMPRLDGISATSQIRQFDLATPIISVTSNSLPSEILTYYSSGMNDVLPKPFTKDGVYKILEKHLVHLKNKHSTNSPRVPNPPPLSRTILTPPPSPPRTFHTHSCPETVCGKEPSSPEAVPKHQVSPVSIASPPAPYLRPVAAAAAGGLPSSRPSSSYLLPALSSASASSSSLSSPHNNDATRHSSPPPTVLSHRSRSHSHPHASTSSHTSPPSPPPHSTYTVLPQSPQSPQSQPPDTDADADDDFGSTQAVDSEEDEVVCACACPTKDCGLRIPRAVLVGSKRKKMFERCRDGDGEFEEGREHKRGKVD